MTRQTAMLVEVTTRLFHADPEEIKRRAEKKSIPWQVELRNLLRQALEQLGEP